MKIIKFLKKIKPIYIILVLFAIVLIVSALGSKTKEGMTSGDYTTLRNYRIQRDDILSDINNFIISQGNSSPWGSTENFKTNFQNYVKIITSYSVKQFFKNKDANADGAVVVRKSDGTFIRDNSGNNLATDEKLFYYDLVAQDQNSDSTIVAFKNTDQGNFYKDNKDSSGNLITSQSLSNTPYILQSIDRNDTVTQTKVDQAKSLLDNQINLLNSADKNTINTSISSLIDVIDKITALTNSTGGGGTNADLYAYNSNYTDTTIEDKFKTATNDIKNFIKAQGSAWGSGDTFLKNLSSYLQIKSFEKLGVDVAYQDEYLKELNDTKALVDNQIALLTNAVDKTTINNYIAKIITLNGELQDFYRSEYADTNNRSRYQQDQQDQIMQDQYNRRYLDADSEWGSDNKYNNPVYSHHRRREHTRINDNSSTNYWKNLYLNTLNSMSGEQTPVYGSLLNGSNGPYDARDASSGTGTGNGITDTSNYDISIPPVQSSTNSRSGSSSGTSAAGKGTAGTAETKTGDAYLLNNSQNSQPTNCPVGGCVTANSAPNNCRPAPVPPCPPCERCPEPKFDCKRVPKYNSSNSQYLPKPVLSDFSQFAM